MAFYAGFDAAVYPGAAAMAWLKQHSNLSWCGYYLSPAPSLYGPAASWRGRRAELAQHWGLAPIYVGQQVRHATVAVAAARTDGNGGNGGNGGNSAGKDRQPAVLPPGAPSGVSGILSATQGRIDAMEAVDDARRDGFAAGTTLYLDWEDGAPLSDAAIDYVAAWVATVRKRGFAPGIYCSHLLGAAFDQLARAEPARVPARIWCFKVSSTAEHQLLTPLTALPHPDPAGCGYARATSWQHEMNAWFELPIAHAGQPGGGPVTRIVADFNTSRLADPGRPG